MRDPLILLWGEPGDPPLEAVRSRLVQSGTPHVVMGSGTRLVRPWSCEAEAVLERRGVEVSLENVTAAYLRPQTDETSPAQGRAVAETLVAWADLTRDALIMNPPSAMAPNTSKPFQARLIAQFGLDVPETLITTDPDAVRAFVRRHGEVVYKSVSGVRSIVRRLPACRLAELDDVTTCPTQFQRYIPGLDLRVHIMGDELQALAIESDRDDYRYAARDGGRVKATEVVLAATLEARLRYMVKAMSLVLAGIDLRQTPSGEIYCLEVNPSPGFTYYERLAGVDLAARIASILARGKT
jgi:glutathione synthase/RimK-type ligase-like ATP-grasp enzyme